MGDISDHFSRYELACKDNCGFDVADVKLIEALELAREMLGTFSPSSVCRCITHNEKIQHEVNPNYKSFSSRSQHLLGKAADIKTKNPEQLYDHLNKHYPDKYGIGLYNWGVHIDVRNRKARWNRT